MQFFAVGTSLLTNNPMAEKTTKAKLNVSGLNGCIKLAGSAMAADKASKGKRLIATLINVLFRIEQPT